MSDPTKIVMTNDPTTERLVGIARHGNTPFNVPYISKITDDLWQGGCETGLILPDFIDHIVSLYPWERYTIRHEIDSELYYRAYDTAGGIDLEEVDQIARWINERREYGTVLVHCQAGLNRSSFVAARALMLGDGFDAKQAITLLREQRSLAVLCNKAFEEALLAL